MPTPPSKVASGAASDPPRCERRSFPPSLPIAETSGAAYVPATANRSARIVVVGDSGTRGQLVEIAASNGEVLLETSLPIDPKAGDDLEGFSRVGDRYFGLTSGGYMRVWHRTDTDYELETHSYPIAPPGKGDPELTCKHPHHVNCGPNYEGLCLRDEPVPEGECLGFAASKAYGALFCLVRDERGRLRADASRRIQLTKPGVLTGCHYLPGGKDELWAGTNLFGGNMVYRVTGTRTPDSAKIAPIGRLGPGFCEAIALAPDGLMYRFSDTGLSPSFCESFVCR